MILAKRFLHPSRNTHLLMYQMTSAPSVRHKMFPNSLEGAKRTLTGDQHG